MKLLSTILFLFLVISVKAETLRVGLYYVSTVRTAEVTNDVGSYVIKADSSIIDTMDGSFSVITYTSGDQVKLKLDGKEIGKYDTVLIEQIAQGSGFKVRSLTHGSKYRPYWGSIEITMGKGKLQMVNIVDLEQYLPGVVESESGSNEGLEYYKIQATISRTYALKHLTRHQSEGFQLCDHTHCQVYRKKSLRNPVIPEAVRESRSMVLVDSDINLITASFFSNCGGQTNNSEDVWSGELPYLRSIKDPFCSKMPHAFWKKEVSKERWLKYVRNKMPTYFKEKGTYTDTFKVDYSQRNRRLYYSNPGFSISLRTIREDFKLRSTFFSIQDKGDKIVFRGRGFGHGVGLCQEGAMRMAELGYSYVEILKFYYTDIHIIHLDDLEFFKID